MENDERQNIIEAIEDCIYEGLQANGSMPFHRSFIDKEFGTEIAERFVEKYVPTIDKDDWDEEEFTDNIEDMITSSNLYDVLWDTGVCRNIAEEITNYVQECFIDA